MYKKNKDGDSCLLLAARNGHLETVKCIDENGYSINERNNDMTNCILMASSKGNMK